MPTIKLGACLQLFKKKVDGTQALLNLLKNYSLLPIAGSPRPLHILEYERLVELFIIEIFTSWEVFLEESFILYLAGKASPNGYKQPTKIKFARGVNKQTVANDIIARLDNKTDWTAQDIVSKRANILFQAGGNYATVFAASNQEVTAWADIKKIRNAAGHKSGGSARDEFRALITREFGAFPSSGISIGQFLGTAKRGTSDTYLKYYCDSLVTLAERLVPN